MSIFGDITNKSYLQQEEAFKTPSKKSTIGVKDILRDDVVVTHNSTPRPRTRSAISEIFTMDEVKPAYSSTRKNQENMFPPSSRVEKPEPPLFSNPSTEELLSLKQENKVLQDNLKNEVKVRSELEVKVSNQAKQLQKVSNDVVSKDSYIQQLEKKVSEEKDANERIIRSFEIQERSLKEQVEREKIARLKAERELSELREAQKNLSMTYSSEIVDLQVSKVQLSKLKEKVTVQEKTLEEKEKSRNRRSIGFHEEHRLRVDLEKRIEEIQHDHQTVVEKLKEEIIDLQDNQSFLKEKVAQLEVDLDISTRKYYDILNVNHEMVSQKAIMDYQMSSQLKEIEELKKKLQVSYSALQVLEMKFHNEVVTAEKKIHWTEEQIELLKLAQYQSQKHSEELEQKALKQKQTLMETERLYSQESSARTHLQEQLNEERLGNIPVMKKKIEEEHVSLVKTSSELESTKRNLASCVQALDLQRVQTQEITQALTNEIQNRKILEKQLTDLNSQAHSAIQQEREARLHLEREYQTLLASMRKNL